MSGEKTEDPTDKKKRDSKEKGQLAVGKDLLTLLKLVFGYWIIFVAMPSFFEGFSNLMDVLVHVTFAEGKHLNAEVGVLAKDLFLQITLPIVAAASVVGIFGTWLQTGFVISTESATPSFKKLDPIPTIKNMFSKKSLVQLVISLIKVALLGAVIYLVAFDAIGDIIYSYRMGLDVMFSLMWDLLQKAVFVSLALFVVLSALDWSVTYFHHLKQIRMSKSEVKDENKQLNGNPELKRYLRQTHRRLLNSSLQRVPSAKVVVANPTHIAIALDYEPGVHDVPYVLAVGVDDDARLIREMAERHQIPVVRNIRLARMIYADCEEDEYIQKQHLELAAAVFKLVFSLSQQRN